MKTLLALTMISSLLLVAGFCPAEEIDLPGLSGYYVSGPRPPTEKVVTVDLTHYAAISSVRVHVSGEWRAGMYTVSGEEYPVSGCIVVWFFDLDLPSANTHFCPSEGPFEYELDTFWLNWNQTVTDWSFLLAQPYEIVVHTTWNGTVTPEIFPNSTLESVTLIVDGVVPNEQSTWGTLKALYR
jgi:hypothetical protein